MPARERTVVFSLPLPFLALQAFGGLNVPTFLLRVTFTQSTDPNALPRAPSQTHPEIPFASNLGIPWPSQVDT